MKLIIEKSGTKESIIAGCLKQQRQAQQDLYDWLAPNMLSLCRRYINDPYEAESVMITGFIKVFKKIEQYSGEGSFEGWIRRIMVNESLLYIRKHKNMYIEVDIDYADREPDYNQAFNNLEANDLLRMINNLPIGYRTVFNMYAIEGYSHKEIAESLNISENTSKSQLSRGRKMLQAQLLKSEKMWDEKSRRDGKA